MSDDIKCTVTVTTSEPHRTCGQPAAVIVRETWRDSHSATYEAPLWEVPSWAMWTGHAACEDHKGGRYEAVSNGVTYALRERASDTTSGTTSATLPAR